MSLLLLTFGFSSLQAEEQSPMEELLSSWLASVQTEAVSKTIMAIGSDAVPSLVQALDSNQHFNSSLGAALLESTFVIEGDDVEPLATSRRLMVGEAASYLILAVLSGNLYHHWSCELVGLEGKLDVKEINRRLIVLQGSLETLPGDQMLTAEKFQEMLTARGLQFMEPKQ